MRNDYGVEKMGVFGSFVRGEQRSESDVDINTSEDQDPEETLKPFTGNVLKFVPPSFEKS